MLSEDDDELHMSQLLEILSNSNSGDRTLPSFDTWWDLCCQAARSPTGTLYNMTITFWSLILVLVSEKSEPCPMRAARRVLTLLVPKLKSQIENEATDDEAFARLFLAVQAIAQTGRATPEPVARPGHEILYTDEGCFRKVVAYCAEVNCVDAAHYERLRDVVPSAQEMSYELLTQCVCLVDGDQPEVLEQPLPRAVLRQHRRVQDVRVGEQHVRARRQLLAVGVWRVAVEGGGVEVVARGVGEGAQGEQNLSGVRHWEPLWALVILATFLSTVAKLKTYSPNFASLKR